MMAFIKFLQKYSALIMIGGTFLWSMIAIAAYRAKEAPGDAIVLRIGHWQLEASVREAFEIMAEDYRKINPRVHIVQDAIPEMVYGQWATTQLMGETAPDMLEVGGMLPYHLWLQYYNRYFIPLTQLVGKPNPYNSETEFADTPLRSTFKDGMRNAYIDELQEYMNVPLSQFGVRIFYNKDLLKKLTGSEIPPGEYREFIKACEKISSVMDENGQPYIPIAGSRYHLPMWEGMMFDPLTFPLYRIADFNRDGTVGNDELYVAFKTERVSFQNPAVKARFKMLREITDHFQVGYTGLTRDEAVFLFAQERAVFMTTGTWDARSLEEQAKGVFEVGVMEFPLPAKDDPYYGQVIEGPVYERPMGGFPFAITRTCKHPDVARDFLLFLSSKEQNEKLNRIIGWIPAIRETEMDPLLKAFEPNLQGVYGCLNLFLGGETWVRWWQLYSQYQINRISYEDMAAEFEPYYEEQGIKDFLELQKDWRRSMVKNEQFLAGIRSKAFFDEGVDQESSWVKYRTLTSSRQVWAEINRARTLRLVEGDGAPPKAPYVYGPDVLKNVRKQIGVNK